MLNLTRAALTALGLCAVLASSPVLAADAPAAAASSPDTAASAAAPAPESAASAAAASEPAPSGSLDDRVQQTKADVIRLNRDLLVPRPAGRFFFARLLNLDGETLHLLPLGIGQRQQVVSNPPWAAVAVRLIRSL